MCSRFNGSRVLVAFLTTGCLEKSARPSRFMESPLFQPDLLMGHDPLWTPINRERAPINRERAPINRERTAVAKRSVDTALHQREGDSALLVPFESAVVAPLCRRTPRPSGRATVHGKVAPAFGVRRL